MARMKNRERLLRKMEALPGEVRAAIRKALVQGADEIVAMQQRLVSVDEGDLRGSIQKEAGGHELQIRIKAGGAATTRPVRQGSSATYDYALANEFGTQEMQARPFFLPAYRTLRKRVRSRITRATKAAARKVAGSGS